MKKHLGKKNGLCRTYLSADVEGAFQDGGGKLQNKVLSACSVGLFSGE